MNQIRDVWEMKIEKNYFFIVRKIQKKQKMFYVKETNFVKENVTLDMLCAFFFKKKIFKIRKAEGSVTSDNLSEK